MRLLVATHNPGKMEEFRALLAPLPAEICFAPDLGLQVSVVEGGQTYEENARLKAEAYARASGLLTLADDSGLEVDALGGVPGIRSARYALGSDADRVAALLNDLDGIPWEQRTARFRCVTAVITGQGELHTAEGTCEGIISTTPAGNQGFGYDPIFYLPELDRTMAQIPIDVKNRISHRARAIRAILPILREQLPPGSIS
ncbi:MAG: RdgB/HAM1 family non-canonical purine NTP pyrophosphatase [Anaerolineae bacterium]